MFKRNMPMVLVIIGCAAIGLGLLLFPRPAAAQCGSSASSCKNCHEVQAKDPVNTKGAWHTDHSFQDFCENCHGGNVKGKDEASAHVGLADPLSDVKASCQACHEKDYMDRAKKYADALGKPIGTGAAPAVGATGAMTSTATTNAPCGPAAPTGGETIDLNKAFAASTVAPGPNVGNLILSALIAGTLLLLLGLVWHYEKPLPKAVTYWRQLLATPVIIATTPEGLQAPVPAKVRRPEFAAVERALANTDPATARAVAHLLADRENGPRILKALANMDLEALTALGESDEKTFAALLALAKEMKSR